MGGVVNKNITSRDFNFYQKLGKGEFGEVILIKNRVNSHFYAVKEINLLKVFESGVKPFMLSNELSALKRLQAHPFITELHYSFLESNYCYIILEYLNGGTLRDLLYIKYIFNERQIAFLIGCLASGLAYIHKHGIIHRDIKPENIVLDCKGYPHIADFGISHVDSSYPNLNGPITCRMTSGTEQYCAPECLAAPHEHGVEVDYWSLGIMMYELFFQVRPFKSRVPKVCVRYVESLHKMKESTEESGFLSKSAPQQSESTSLPSKSPSSPLKYLCSFWKYDSPEQMRRKPQSNTHEVSHRSMTLKYDNDHSVSFSFAGLLNKTNRVVPISSVRVAAPSNRVVEPSVRDDARQLSSRPVSDNSGTSSVNQALVSQPQVQLLPSSSIEDIVCPHCNDALPSSLTVPLPPAQYYIHTRRERPSPAFVSILGMLLDIRPNHRIGHSATSCRPAILDHEWFTEQQLPVPALVNLSVGNISSTSLNFDNLPGLPLHPSPLPTHLIPDRRQLNTSIKQLLPNKKLRQLRNEIGDFSYTSSRYCSNNI